MTRGIHLIISGEVQGVGYRYFARNEANRLRLCGWVRNLRDGRVEAYAEGEERSIEIWVSRLWRGPVSARVEEILPVWEPVRCLNGFTVETTVSASEPFRRG